MEYKLNVLKIPFLRLHSVSLGSRFTFQFIAGIWKLSAFSFIKTLN